MAALLRTKTRSNLTLRKATLARSLYAQVADLTQEKRP